MTKSKIRYTKRNRLERLKEARLASRKKWMATKFPDTWRIDKGAKMRSIFQENRKKKRVVILDVDGTICEHIGGKRKHQKVPFRPYFEEFVSEALKFCDLFIFSSMDIIRLQNLWKKHFCKGFSGYFDRSLLMRYQKNICPLLELGSEVLLIDDNQDKSIPGQLLTFWQ